MKLYVGVKAVIKNSSNGVLVLREAKYDEGINEGKWDVPGGRINPEEPLLLGLQREVREECGLEIESGAVLGVFETFPVIKNEACHIVRIYYECRPLSLEVKLGNDHDNYEWINPKAFEGRDFVSDIKEVLKRV